MQNAVADGAGRKRNSQSTSLVSLSDSRDRIMDFVDFVDEEVGTGHWREIDVFASDRDFLTPAGFVQAMHNIGFKRIPS